ncbi:MAG: PEP/pyruvate-binding domain-containing protein [Acidobacteriota bacterium]
MNTLRESIAPQARRAARQIRRGLAGLWRGLLEFLEIIGLREERRIEHASQLARFRLNHTEFRKLLSANNSFLETISDLEAKLLGDEFFDRGYVRRKSVRAVADIHRMVESLAVISECRYPQLNPAFDRITAELTGALQETRAAASEDLVLSLEAIGGSHSDLVGGKMSNLGELKSALSLPVPDGFAVTTAGFKLLLEESGVESAIQDELMTVQSAADVQRVSGTVQELVLGARVPDRLASAILNAYDGLEARSRSLPRLAVRSSALGEDGDRSFAGQFLTELNVSRDGLLDAYLRVVASLYSPEAIHYRMLHGIPAESSQMAVGCIAMVDAVASGIMFSVDPNHPDDGTVLIHALRGLGVRLADGSSSAETIQVTVGGPVPTIRRAQSTQESRVVCGSDRGVVEEAMEAVEQEGQCVTDEEAVRLSEWARALEMHFGCPQDIEWAVDVERRPTILQSRPLLVSHGELRASPPVPGYKVLVTGGEVACPGVGHGPAAHLDQDGDMDSFPPGAVLIAKRSSPKFVRVMDKARAIVTDAGSTTGHMASLAREFRVPTLLNTGIATRSIADGAMITVDAGSGRVYEGEVTRLIEMERLGGDERENARLMRESPAFRFLQEAADLIVPLNLTDPRSRDFTVDNCRTLHDLARYIHEMSYEEMFRMGEKLGDVRSSSYYLDVFLPVDLYIVDLGGGLEAPARGRKVKLPQVKSLPLAALLKGMLHEGIPRFGPRPMDLGGFFSIMMRHAMTSPEQERTFRDPCYAIVSDRYLNYTARVGYHFGVVDTYCGFTANKNYISFHFKGGAADRVRRSRRVLAIAGILKEHGFSVWVNRDLVNARLGKAPRDETARQLEMIGRLLQFFRQLDVSMASDESIRYIQDAFLRGDYSLERGTGQGDAETR